MAIFYKDQRLTHMSIGDAYLWSKFIDKKGIYYSGFEYDVRVGAKVTLPPNSPDWLFKSADSLSQKRIDVVMHDPKHIYIVEVRGNANAGVLGNLIVYKQLYIASYKPVKPVLPFLVTDTPHIDLVIAMKELRIPYQLV